MSILIETEREGALRQRITLDEIHDLHADVAESAGGEGCVPDPHDYFDMSLGSCKALTVMMYARRKEIPLKGVSVRVTRDASREREGHYRLDVSIGLIGELSGQARERLQEIADQCPIHKLMTGASIEVNTETHLS
ncbi:putative redox protein [Kushneria sinocarnis]|uniref:Putative redox protein n=1 Tax=Kushneria sinocarnis TaxID=595502 RepID=A0A420WY53_9GAMM|nr:OsmC family protein [Kushneria sinocarnis]RKR06157.1 putative redox protein [Kushneria sinocarnis]